MWNATASQSGTQVSVTNATYHATIQAMARSIGFNGSWHGINNAQPASRSTMPPAP
jgi:hypothetical protein